MLKFNVDEFLPYLSSAASVVSNKSVFPILSCVMIRANSQDGAIITTSDGETWFTTRARLSACDGTANFCVDANDFVRALVNLKGQAVTVNVNGDKNQIECLYESGRFALPFFSCDEFPKAEIPSGNKEVILKSGILLNCIAKTLFATANDELRPVMNGIHFDFTSDGMACAATDGHKLVKYGNTDVEIQSPETYSVTLPKKPASIIKSVIDGVDSDVRVAFDDRYLSVSNEAFRLVTRLCEQSYPDYNRVIPTDNNIEAVVNKEELIMALKRVTPMCHAANEVVKLEFNKEQLTLIAEDYDLSKSARERLTMSYTGDDIAIGFKAPFLLGLLSNIDGDNVNIAFKDEKHAVLFRPVIDGSEAKEYYTSLLMPMIISM